MSDHVVGASVDAVRKSRTVLNRGPDPLTDEEILAEYERLFYVTNAVIRARQRLSDRGIDMDWATGQQFLNELPEDVRALISPVPQLYTKIWNRIKDKPEALDMEDWHTCDTVHCIAGWATVVAGAQGMALEALLSEPLAAYLIFAASYPTRHLPHFYMDDLPARAWLERHAAAESRSAKG